MGLITTIQNKTEQVRAKERIRPLLESRMMRDILLEIGQRGTEKLDPQSVPLEQRPLATKRAAECGTAGLQQSVIREVLLDETGIILYAGTGEVRFAAPQITPESTATKPSDVYKPGTTLDRTLEYRGYSVPIYRDRPLNVFSDVDFIWTGEENENQRRLEYLGGEFRTRYGIDVSSFQGEIDWDAVADDNIDFAMVRVGFRGTGTGSLITDKY